MPRPAEQLTWTIPDLAALLGVHENTMRALVKRGDIPTLRIGRRVLITKKRGEEWIDANSASTLPGVDAPGGAR